jgi:hypothetical protein
LTGWIAGWLCIRHIEWLQLEALFSLYEVC